MAVFEVLFVCSANVCRSPTSEVVASVELTRLDMSDAVRVQSAGVNADPGKPWCPKARAWALKRLNPQPTHEREAQLLSPSMLKEADLILAMDSATAAGAIRLDPECRQRVFVMRSAEVLCRHVESTLTWDQQPVTDGLPVPPASDAVARLRWCIEEMDANRGLVTPGSTTQSGRLWRRRRPEGHTADIRDAHVNAEVSHREVLSVLDDSVRSIIGTFARVLAD